VKDREDEDQHGGGPAKHPETIETHGSLVPSDASFVPIY